MRQRNKRNVYKAFVYELNGNITTVIIKDENAVVLRIRRHSFGKETIFQLVYTKVIGHPAILGSSLSPFKDFAIRKPGN